MPLWTIGTAQGSPTHLRAPPGQLGSRPWPQEPAAGRPRVEDVALSTSRSLDAQLAEKKAQINFFKASIIRNDAKVERLLSMVVRSQ